jgi:hypothetical protein
MTSNWSIGTTTTRHWLRCPASPLRAAKRRATHRENPAVTAKLGTLRADYPNAGVGRVVRLDAR